MTDPMENLEADAAEALHEHVLRTARLGEQRYAPFSNLESLQPLLADREIVRYPVDVVFDEAALEDGEFACTELLTTMPADGFRLSVHPHFEHHATALPLLIAYHIPSVNYGPIISAEHAEQFGAALLGMKVDTYYDRICALADSIGS
ncbi:MAG: hypothetical protein QGG74_05625 [Phycisphaerales bacterium]|jgi:hypothetical protein|nr:hypothetical protein [Phycisphaerales bacterium]